jgi:filamentous hemagglutinin family protein
MLPRLLPLSVRGGRPVRVGTAWLLMLVGAAPGTAQIVLDGKFGTSGPLTGPNYSITADLGRTRGNNLFHSFTQFDLNSGDTATFSGPGNIQNILARVTGGNASSIDGTVRSDIAGANLFLINPNGVIFGPNAVVDVTGSFAASTANYLKLADGARFVAALDADDSGLSTAPVSAFGFLGNSPGTISIQQSTLAVQEGRSISLIGGDIAMDGGLVQAPGGQINLASVQSLGEVPVDPAAPSVAEFKTAFPQQGQITMQNGAQLNASGEGGGRIVIRGGRLLVDNSKIEANTIGANDGQGIDVAVVNDLALLNGGQIKALSPAGFGAGGNINVSAQSVLLDGGGAVDENFFPSTQISTSTGDLFLGGGSGRGGDIVIQTDSLELINSAQISSATFGLGDAGRIDITASSVRLDAQFASSVQIAANSQPFDGVGGNAGDIVISTDTLDILNGASLVATTYGSGNAGAIDITAKFVNLVGFGLITPATYGTGNGGSVKVTADSVLLDSSFIQAVTTFNDADPTLAQGGNISINAGLIDIRNGGLISATTLGSGAGGTIDLTANSIRLTGDNGASGLPTGIRAASGQDFGDGFILVGTGNSGDIVINPKSSGALDLSVSKGAEISTATLGSGNGGSVDISVSSLRLNSGGYISSASLSLEPGAGVAGDVTVEASGPVVLRNRGLITTAAPNSAGGNISVTAGTEIRLKNSDITAQAGPGGGGNITLKAPDLVYLLNSTVSAEAVGDGGNVTIDPVFFVLNDSSLISRSSSANGGNISIFADYFFQSSSLIDASAPFGLPGTVSVTAPDLDLSGSLIGLPSNLLDVENQLRPDCRVRLAEKMSSFIMLGRGGLPLEPGGFVPSGSP